MTPADPEGVNKLPNQEKERMDTARNLADAANADNSLVGYAAINGLNEDSEIARRAHEFFLERQRTGEPGDAEGDWFRAEQEIRRDRTARNAG